MSLTGISTQMLPLRFTNKFWPPWPKPENSIDSTEESIVVGDKNYWRARGPAQQVFETINYKIKLELDQRENELYDGIAETSVPHSWSCYMVGKEKSKACPFIVITCSQKLVGMHIMIIVKTASWWKQFTHDNPGFGRFSLLPCPPVRLGSSGLGGTIWAHTDWDQSLYDIEILATMDSTNVDNRQTGRTAFLGGIIFVDDKPYGLTVAHPFTTQQRDFSAAQIGSPLEAYYEDSIDDDSSDDSTEPSYHSSIDRLSSGSAQKSPLIAGDSRLKQTTTPEPIANFSTHIGHVTSRTDGGPCDDVDWALVKLRHTTEELSKLVDEVSELSSTCFRGDGSVATVRPPKSFANEIREAKSVFLSSAENHLTSGTLDPCQTFVCLDGSRQYISLFAVTTNESLSSGDCGKWVVDENECLHGHVVAGNRSLKTAYIATVTAIVNSIHNTINSSSIRLLGLNRLFRTFRHAVRSDDISRVQMLMNQIPEMNAANSGISGILTDARDRKDIVKLLLTRPDINVNLGQPLAEAARYGYKETVKLLLAHPDVNVNLGQPLAEAVEYKRLEIVELLLAHLNVDVNLRQPLAGAARSGREQIVKLLLTHPDTNINLGQPLSEAAGRGHKEIVELLLAHPDVDVNLGQPLYCAVKYEWKEVVKLLLAHPDVNVNLGQPLYHAAKYGGKEVVKLLLAHPDINVNLEQPLAEELKYKYPKIAELLSNHSSMQSKNPLASGPAKIGMVTDESPLGQARQENDSNVEKKQPSQIGADSDGEVAELPPAKRVKTQSAGLMRLKALEEQKQGSSADSQ